MSQYDIRESYRATVTSGGVTTQTDYDTEDLLKIDLTTNTALYPQGVPVIVDKVIKTYNRYAIYNIPGGDELPVLTIDHSKVGMDRSSYQKHRVSVGTPPTA